MRGQWEAGEISIPYGAIKRQIRQIIRDIEREISIPYGAIKSIYLKTAFFISLTFQFLMVRLKEKKKKKSKKGFRNFNSLWCD